jgi:hypothetical protein
MAEKSVPASDKPELTKPVSDPQKPRGGAGDTTARPKPATTTATSRKKHMGAHGEQLGSEAAVQEAIRLRNLADRRHDLLLNANLTGGAIQTLISNLAIDPNLGVNLTQSPIQDLISSFSVSPNLGANVTAWPIQSAIEDFAQTPNLYANLLESPIKGLLPDLAKRNDLLAASIDSPLQQAVRSFTEGQDLSAIGEIGKIATDSPTAELYRKLQAQNLDIRNNLSGLGRVSVVPELIGPAGDGIGDQVRHHWDARDLAVVTEDVVDK